MKLVHAGLGLGLFLCLSAGHAAAHSPEGKSYHVTVYASFGDQFDDCFRFGKNGTLIVDGFVGSLAYALDELNKQP